MIKKYLILLISFLSGSAFMGYEILGSRIMAPYFGGSVYTWGGMIAVFMTGMSIGYSIGGRLSSIISCRKSLIYTFLSASILIIIVSIISKSICNVILQLDIDNRYSVLIASFIFFFIPSILWGMVPPFLVTLIDPFLEGSAGRAVGRVYTFSTLGSIIGILVVSFVLIVSLGTADNLCIIGGVLFLCATMSCFLK